MRKPKYRIDTYATANQMLIEDRLDELAEQQWHFVAAFVYNGLLWVVSKRSWWWRVTH